MRHPVLYRVIMYTIMGALCLCIVFMLSLMNEAPFTSRNMRSAYFAGCNFGGLRPLTDDHAMYCEKYSNLYKETLDDIDRQMEKLGE